MRRRFDAVLPAILLAAGQGSRLAPLTDLIPKCLVPVRGLPLLGHWLNLLGSSGLSPIIINTGRHAEAVRKFAGKSPWKKKLILTHEEKLLGTGGTLLANREHLAGGTFFAAHADNLSRFDPADFIAAHRTRPANCLLTMLLFRSPTPESCGIVELDARGVVVAFHEKVAAPPGNLANGAVYLMEPEILDLLTSLRTPKPDISLDLLPLCLGRIYTWLNPGYHRDIGTPESYAAALEEFTFDPINNSRRGF
ncbi:MAG: nucleotidyltransferase family protein [Planctomycetota bacterium]|nr:nucleotidyltransferase family protein [Planctomycetota bacterium]